MMTVTMHSDPLELSKEAAQAGGLQGSKHSSERELHAVTPDEDAYIPGNGTLPRNPRAEGLGFTSSPAGPGAMAGAYPDMPGGAAAAGFGSNRGGPLGMAEGMRRSSTMTAEKLARGIVAIGGMSAASITKTATAVGGAIQSYSANLMNQTAPLSQPLTVSKNYVQRLNLTRKFTQPAAYAADLAAQYLGELLYYLVQGAWAVYIQLAAMKVLPQIAAGGKSDASGVPMNPVSGGLPMATDELAAFKLVGAALIMAYVEVYDALEEATQLLFKQASTAGERYLAHRHGGEAADVAAAALAIMADMLSLVLNWFRIMGRGFFSKTATNSARTYLLARLPDLHLD